MRSRFNIVPKPYQILLFIVIAALAGCAGEDGGNGAIDGKARNVILFIGDGMGVGQISLLTLHRRVLTPHAPQTAFERLSNEHYAGMIDNYMYDGLVTDSAAAATQMGCGILTVDGVIGLDASGIPCQTVLEEAHGLGKSTGLVTDTTITHATPAAFVAKQVDRDDQLDIAEDMITGVSRGKVDVLLGGGGHYMIPSSMRFSQVAGCEDIDPSLDGAGRRIDDQNLIAEAERLGYQFVCSSDELDAVAAAPGKRVLGLFGSSSFPDYLQRDAVAGLPSTRDMAAKAIEILEQDQDGFFLMVEVGQIDWGAHDNDGGYVFAGMQEANDTLLYLMEYVEEHPDTLLLVTADHETGGMGFASWAEAPDSYAYLTSQTRSYDDIIDPVVDALYFENFEPDPAYPLEQAALDLASRVEQYTAHTLTVERAKELLYVPAGSEIVPQPQAHDQFFKSSPFTTRLAMEFAPETRLMWSTSEHTSEPVPLFAMGPREYAERVLGHGHNTDVGHIIFAALHNDVDRRR